MPIQTPQDFGYRPTSTLSIIELLDGRQRQQQQSGFDLGSLFDLVGMFSGGGFSDPEIDIQTQGYDPFSEMMSFPGLNEPASF